MQAIRLVLVFLLLLTVAGCASHNGDEPSIRVYFHEEDAVRQMGLETYLEGVVAGEMKNTFPLEALKAQAIVARTYTLAKMAEGGTLKREADASTDIREFQAYRAEAVNDAVKQAVRMTRGKVLMYDGEAIMAWFHASAGGQTATAEEGLAYTKKETPYIVSVLSQDEDAPEDVRAWEAVFTQAEIIDAVSSMQQHVDAIESFSQSQVGPSGRTMQFCLNGTTAIDAPSFRMAIGSTKLPSLLLKQVIVEDQSVRFVGQGYGHGVGMSQWGAHHMAQEGASAEDIVMHYYPGAKLEQWWE